jgi:glycosyltransferase involved in cell wall biosynthesis
MIVGIDGSNLGPGGSMTHLSNVLAETQPAEYGITKVVIWTSRANLARLPERPWLERVHEPALDRSLPHRLWWQRFALPRFAAGCAVLFVPSGNTLARTRPMVSMSQNMLPFEWKELRRYGASWMALRLLLLRFGQTATFRHSDGVVFVSEYASRAIGDRFGPFAHTTVSPHGIEPRFRNDARVHRPFEDFTEQRPFRVLYVSIVDVYKHQWHLAEAAARLRAGGLPIAVDFVGPAFPPALARLRVALGRLDPGERFLRYRGAVPFAEVDTVYREADAFAFPSSCENMPNIVLEAMAAGLPIACSNRGPMPEALGDGGVYFDPEQPGEIAAALEELARDSALRTRCASLAQERAKAYTWQRCARETMGFVSSLAKP